MSQTPAAEIGKQISKFAELGGARFKFKQEAQLWLGWPTHGAKSIYLAVKVIERN